MTHELTKFPLAFVDPALFVDKFSISTSLSVNPLAYVVVTIRVDESSIAMVDVVLELTLIDDVVDLFAYSSDLAVRSKLSQNVLVVLRLPERSSLVNVLVTVPHDVFESQWTKFIPLILGCLQCYAVAIIRGIFSRLLDILRDLQSLLMVGLVALDIHRPVHAAGTTLSLEATGSGLLLHL